MAKTIRELLTPKDEIDAHACFRELAERVEAVLKLHEERKQPLFSGGSKPSGQCICGLRWPCPTRRALDGLGEGK